MKMKHEPTNDLLDSRSGYISAEERRAAGKALRDATPRVAHGAWKEPRDRRDPIELLHESNEGRMPELIPIRFGRMAQSPFAFYRGSAAVMAADLATTQTSGLRVQACGDAHLLNFGGFATPERNIFFDINDFDETLPAPWEWDVKRLAASIVIAARHVGLLDSAAGIKAHGLREPIRLWDGAIIDGRNRYKAQIAGVEPIFKGLNFRGGESDALAYVLNRNLAYIVQFPPVGGEHGSNEFKIAHLLIDSK